MNILQFKFFYKDHDDLNTPISAARGGMKRELSAIEKIVFVVFIQRICTAFVGIKFKLFPFAWLSHGKGQPHESRIQMAGLGRRPGTALAAWGPRTGF